MFGQDPSIACQRRSVGFGSRRALLVVDIVVVVEAVAAAVAAVAAAVLVVWELFASSFDLAAVVVQVVPQLVALARSRILTHIRTDPLAGFAPSRCREMVSV